MAAPPRLGTQTVRSLAHSGRDRHRSCQHRYRPVRSAWLRRGLYPLLVAAMLRGGFTAEDAAKIAGGNYMRIFRDAVG